MAVPPIKRAQISQIEPREILVDGLTTFEIERDEITGTWRVTVL